MKILYLLRHAKSGWDNAELDDSERPLSRRGVRNAALMGRELKERGIRPAAVFSSSSRRTRETLEIIAPVLGFPLERVRFEDALYLAAEKTLIDFILHLDDGLDEVMFCGHNPGLEETARFFLGKKAEKFPTCAFLEIRFAGDSWRRAAPDTVKKKVFLSPAMFGDGG